LMTCVRFTGEPLCKVRWSGRLLIECHARDVQVGGLRMFPGSQSPKPGIVADSLR